jgi:hypothetical protein
MEGFQPKWNPAGLLLDGTDVAGLEVSNGNRDGVNQG